MKVDAQAVRQEIHPERDQSYEQQKSHKRVPACGAARTSPPTRSLIREGELLGLKRHLALDVLLHSLIRQLSGLLSRPLCRLLRRLLSRRWTLEAHGVPLGSRG
jgi:hypothetical protein